MKFTTKIKYIAIAVLGLHAGALFRAAADEDWRLFMWILSASVYAALFFKNVIALDMERQDHLDTLRNANTVFTGIQKHLDAALEARRAADPPPPAT